MFCFYLQPPNRSLTMLHDHFPSTRSERFLIHVHKCIKMKTSNNIVLAYHNNRSTLYLERLFHFVLINMSYTHHDRLGNDFGFTFLVPKITQRMRSVHILKDLPNQSFRLKCTMLRGIEKIGRGIYLIDITLFSIS